VLVGQAQHYHPLAVIQKSGGPVLDNPAPAVVIHARTNAERLNHCPADPSKPRDLSNCDRCPIKGADGCPFGHDDPKTIIGQRAATEQGKKR
jgi:hypothetical protein